MQNIQVIVTFTFYIGYDLSLNQDMLAMESVLAIYTDFVDVPLSNETYKRAVRYFYK